MEYTFKEITIQELVNLIDKDKIDLSPSYQRNFIWSPNDQSILIDTIINGYPLPSFFLYEKPDGNFEMVDGQQRSRTIFRFVKGHISSSNNLGKIKFSESNQDLILCYRLPFILIKNLRKNDSLKDFYVLINKRGKHLNVAEVNKSEFHDTNFLRLSEEVLDYQNFINLNLFSEAVSKRMNDRAFIEELLAYLKFGIKEKKDSVELLYKEDIDTEEYIFLRNKFCKIIDRIEYLNKYWPLKNTRYKQKNDFYTLFNFIDQNMSLDNEVLLHQYKILLVINGTDEDGLQMIRPSNEKCQSLREYAQNCVTQSNSKSARENRLLFFNKILKNVDLDSNSTFLDLLNYLCQVFGEEKVELIKKGEFNILNVELLN